MARLICSSQQAHAQELVFSKGITQRPCHASAVALHNLLGSPEAMHRSRSRGDVHPALEPGSGVQEKKAKRQKRSDDGGPQDAAAGSSSRVSQPHAAPTGKPRGDAHRSSSSGDVQPAQEPGSGVQEMKEQRRKFGDDGRPQDASAGSCSRVSQPHTAPMPPWKHGGVAQPTGKPRGDANRSRSRGDVLPALEPGSGAQEMKAKRRKRSDDGGPQDAAAGSSSRVSQPHAAPTGKPRGDANQSSSSGDVYPAQEPGSGVQEMKSKRRKVGDDGRPQDASSGSSSRVSQPTGYAIRILLVDAGVRQESRKLVRDARELAEHDDILDAAEDLEAHVIAGTDFPEHYPPRDSLSGEGILSVMRIPHGMCGGIRHCGASRGSRFNC